jgi:hypothetical protein
MFRRFQNSNRRIAFYVRRGGGAYPFYDGVHRGISSSTMNMNDKLL